jgi:hypothetical protein
MEHTMMTNRGWIGSASMLYHALATFGCDRDADGTFCVDGSIVSFMGAGDEFVVDAAAVYYVDGQPRHLAAALETTSYGCSAVVIAYREPARSI